MLKRLPKLSLASRFFLVMIGLLLSTQLVVNELWEQQTRQEREKALREVSLNMALRVSSTIEYFAALPTQYRHIVLNQLRYMGGTRYLVMLNEEFLQIDSFSNGTTHDIVLEEFRQLLQQNNNASNDIDIRFSLPNTLKAVNNETLLKDLSHRWNSENLDLGEHGSPILVVQVKLAKNEWLYLATILPESSVMSPDFLTQPLNWSYLLWMLVILAVASLLIHYMTRPFTHLAQVAKHFGLNLKPVQLSEKGCYEYESTASAFNNMQQNIRHFMNDRKLLFTGISHDLKTPITRLRLRAEFLDDNEHQAEFIEDLDHLDMMVKSALQTLSDTDIHENAQRINLGTLLAHTADTAVSIGQSVTVDLEPDIEITGKSLALKRCFENLINNACTYGQKAHIQLFRVPGQIIIKFRDYGPGISENEQELMFKPYSRLEHGRQSNPDGHGLGLLTARHLAHIHSGILTLHNHSEGGLEVIIKFPEETSY
ncbi:two-component sensor histidine kinase [Endozoicomonas sp. OPT23]|uniref:ATP-binding protein n=1 Tax=Endozoicomonas sp. OPT23 TaxID=2072845 RepID=UPI00129A780B|nr:ATP-binding protein [Endozoicomonas sp. OPT23]MRI34048.1 two-component sensor histidine kinase [Endozoicomonas sp. OPT23]